jgi:hydroxymethylpyrimidine/phosphomethylpyrimidine kinase
MQDLSRARSIPNVLTIAGSDPSGGAGIQADLRTFAALGVYGCAAVSLLTAQNTREVAGVLPTPPEFVGLQLSTLFDDVEIDAVKIGALGDASVVEIVAAELRSRDVQNIVLDPIVRAGTGAPLLDEAGLIALRRELLPLASLVTPNAAEMGALIGGPAPSTRREALDAARALHGIGAVNVLLTGGHIDDGRESVDLLFDGQRFHEMRVRRSAVLHTHGTGCTLSAAIAALLAYGCRLAEACNEAQRFVAMAIEASDALDVGDGARPVHQLAEIWRSGATAMNDVREVS